jgi:hypothetical protein
MPLRWRLQLFAGVLSLAVVACAPVRLLAQTPSGAPGGALFTVHGAGGVIEDGAGTRRDGVPFRSTITVPAAGSAIMRA